jgi:outer membrane receptor protein involved in Fe transport
MYSYEKSVSIGILVFSLSNFAFSQWPGAGGKMPAIGVVNGSVMDSTSGLPIEYASISLVNMRSDEVVTGALSDKTGRFNIREIPLGRYRAVVEFIGYATKEISPLNIFPGEGGGIEQNLGNIQLQISSINLAGVEVLGESQFIQTIDKQIFTVGKNLAASGGSGEDVLNQVPTVAVDIDGNITLRGDANVTVLIDGKKVGFDRRSMVDNLQASMIEKVEVITNPSAKYDPDGVGGIINLVLKRGAFEGFNGSTSISAGEYNKNNISGNLNFRTDTWNLFSSTSYRTGERYSDGLREFDRYWPVIQNPDSLTHLYQNTERTRNSDNISFRFGGDIYPTPTSIVSYTSTFSKRDQDSQEIVKQTQPILNILDVQEIGLENDWDYSLSYENKFDSKNKKLNADVSYGYGMEDETEKDSLGNEIKDHQNNKSIIASFDYEDKLGENFDLEAGFKTTLKALDDDLFFDDLDYNYNYNEDIYALYTTLGYEINDRLGLKGGLRFEQVETKAKVTGDTTAATSSVTHFVINQAVKEGKFNNPYSHFYPSVFLNYKLTEKQQIQFGYSKRVNRPGTRSLNPFPRKMQDITHIRTGNPYVKPEYSDVMEINFSSNSRKFNFNTGISYKHTTDQIAWWDRDEIIYNGRPYELLTSGNAESAENLGGSVIINYRPMPLASFMLTTWWWRSETDGGQYEEDMTGTSYGMYNRGQLTLNIPTVARLELSVGGRGTMKITSGTIPANFGADLGIEKSFMNNQLSVTLKVNDLFDNRKFIIDTTQDYELYTQEMYAERKRGRRTTSLNLRYNFGKQQKKKWDRRNFGGRGGGGGGGMDMDY